MYRKKTISMFVTALLLFGIISFGLYNTSVVSYADNLEVIGDDLGLQIIPEDTKLFNILNFNPGDRVSSEIKIMNTYTQPFGLTLKSERIGSISEPAEADIYDIMKIKVSFKGSVLHDETKDIDAFASEPIDLGRFNPGDEAVIVAEVSLPGEEATNIYQGQSVEFKWIFEAVADQPPGDDGGGDDGDDGDDTNDDGDDTDDDTPITEIEDEVVPLAEPVIEDEPIPSDTTPLEEIIDELIPLGVGVLPKTGEVTPYLFYGAGAILVAFGLRGYRKK